MVFRMLALARIARRPCASACTPRTVSDGRPRRDPRHHPAPGRGLPPRRRRRRLRPRLAHRSAACSARPTSSWTWCARATSRCTGPQAFDFGEIVTLDGQPDPEGPCRRPRRPAGHRLLSDDAAARRHLAHRRLLSAGAGRTPGLIPASKLRHESRIAQGAGAAGRRSRSSGAPTGRCSRSRSTSCRCSPSAPSCWSPRSLVLLAIMLLRGESFAVPRGKWPALVAASAMNLFDLEHRDVARRALHPLGPRLGAGLHHAAVGGADRLRRVRPAR